MGKVGSEPPRVGRPRDPSIDAKALQAALKLYAGEGLSGLSFEAVAREAKVGKPALYRRWVSIEELLVDAIEEAGFPSARDCGSFRQDLLDYAQQWVVWYTDPYRALAVQRLYPDRVANPWLHDVFDRRIRAPRLETARDITRRAARRGEVRDHVRSGLAVEMVLGTLMTHYMTTPSDRYSQLSSTFDSYAVTVVNAIVQGVTGPTEG